MLQLRRFSSRVINRLDYKKSAYSIPNVSLTFDISDGSNVMCRGELTLIKEDHHGQQPLELHGHESMSIKDVKLLTNNNLNEQFNWQVMEEGGIKITNLSGDKNKIEIISTLNPNKNSSLIGLYESKGNLFTQCEPEGFRKIAPFLDRPDNLASFEVTIIANKNDFPILLSNGNMVKQGFLENGKHFASFHDPFKKPSYLFALVCGQFNVMKDSFITKSKRKIDLGVYVDKDVDISLAKHAMSSLKKSMKWDEDVYNLEYDLDMYNIVAVSDFVFGAMENKSLNIFNAKYVLYDASSATDSDYHSIESIVAHEYFHNYTGNRVTCRDWFQLTLKEGLTVLRDQQFSADSIGAGLQRINDVKTLRSKQFPEDLSPNAHSIRPNSFVSPDNFYTPTVYEKGAEVLRMLSVLVGKENFIKGVQHYLKKHDGSAATCEDFLNAIEDQNPKAINYKQFSKWYESVGTPTLDVETKWNAEKKIYSMEITQKETSSKLNLPLLLPINVGFLDRESGKNLPCRYGKDASDNSLCLHLDQRKQVFEFQLNSSNNHEPVLSFLRNFSSPVFVNITHQSGKERLDDLPLLMTKDSDQVSRWMASQEISKHSIRQLYDEKHGGTLPFSKLINDCLDQNVNHFKAEDDALLYEMLCIPSFEELSVEFVPIKPVHLILARENLISDISKQSKSLLLETYQSRQEILKDAELPYSKAIAHRSLSNICLSILFQGETKRKTFDDKIINLANKQYFESSTNMTNRISALSCLSLLPFDHKARREALHDFQVKYAKNDVVCTKLISILANNAKISELLELKKSSLMDLRQPNKVYSFLGSLIKNKFFHSKDGYDFLADQVRELDKINPSVAARMVKQFSLFKSYDDSYKVLQQENLNHLSKENLSKEVLEIVNNSLK